MKIRIFVRYEDENKIEDVWRLESDFVPDVGDYVLIVHKNMFLPIADKYLIINKSQKYVALVCDYVSNLDDEELQFFKTA